MTAPTFRLDRLTGTWVALAPARIAASGIVGETLPVLSSACPFCPGNEPATDRELARWPAEGDWRVRVVRNRYPVVTSELAAARVPSPFERDASGEHELVIESPDHDADLATMTDEQCALVLEALVARTRALALREGTREVAVFRNRGRRSGSSQPHPHTQVTSLPFVTPVTARRFEIARDFSREHGAPLVQTLLGEELAFAERIVEEGDAFVAYSPFAAHRRYELLVVPRRRVRHLLALDEAAVKSLARVLRRSLARLRAATGGVDYNLVVRQPPLDAPDDDSSSFYLEVIPRTGGPAGFELATGVDIVVLTPEAGATLMRAVTLP